MNNELIKQASKLFPSFEHWKSFQELADNREAIYQFWYTGATNKIRQHFKESLNPAWSCIPMPNGDLLRNTCWFLQEFGKDSIGIYIGWHYELQLRPPVAYNFDEYNIKNILQLIENSEYNLLRNAFVQIDQNNFGSLLRDSRNFEFNGESVRQYRQEDLAWFAGYEMQSFVDQVITKIEKFTNNQEVTDLIRKLNRVAINGSSV